jgi:hypothetical protein
MAEFKRHCEEVVKISREDSQNAIMLNNQKLQIEQQFVNKQVIEMSQIIKSQKAKIEQLQSCTEDRADDIRYLTSFDERNLRIKELQNQFMSINDMVSEHSMFRDSQTKLLDEYTNMIDIGIARIPRFDQCPQTDLSLNNIVPARFKKITDLSCGMDDQEIVENVYEPILALCQSRHRVNE